MKGERTAGALQYPAYLLVWSVGLLLFTGSFYRADAALVSAPPIAFQPLASVPSLVSDGEFRVDLDAALDESEVMAGNWQPGQGPQVEAVQRPSSQTLKTPVKAVRNPPSDSDSRDTRKSEVPVRKAADSGLSSSAAQVSMEKRPVSTPSLRVSEEVVALRREARNALRNGDSNRAFRVLMRNVGIAANDKEYLALLAVAALEQRLPREALLVYEKLIKLDRLDSRWWMGLAVCQERLGADATTIYEEVVRLTEEGSDLQRLALDRLGAAAGVT